MGLARLVNLFQVICLVVTISSCEQNQSNKLPVQIQRASPMQAEASPVKSSERFNWIADAPSVTEEASLVCLDDKTCWIHEGKKIWRTQDTGKTWELMTSVRPHELTVMGVSYKSPQLGWIWYIDGCYKTEDGGRSWNRCSPTPIDYPRGALYSLDFSVDLKKGWVSGGSYTPKSRSKDSGPPYLYSADNNSVLEPVIYATADGGVSWERQIESSPTDIGIIKSLRFIDSTHGFASSDNRLLYTEDGGKKWLVSRPLSRCVEQDYLEPGYEGKILDYFVLGIEYVWISYDDGRIARSTDGGKTYCNIVDAGELQLAQGKKGVLSKVLLHDQLNGLGYAKDSLVYETTDGGQTWAPIDSTTQISSIDLKTGLALAKGKLLRILPRK